jgi:hypothetical protein
MKELKDASGQSLDITLYGGGTIDKPTDAAIIEFLLREAFARDHNFAQAPQPTPHTPQQEPTPL